MYKAPQLQRYGTLRELTLGGGNQFTDFFGPTSDGNSGCVDNAPNGVFCVNS